jgi:hypothetical protein
MLLGQHQQYHIAFGKVVDVRHHRFGNQPVALLDQDMAQTSVPGIRQDAVRITLTI